MCSQSPYAACDAPPPPEIVLLDVTKGTWDYYLTLERVDGLQIKVQIPVKDSGYEDDMISEPNMGSFGLNLTTQGHYI